MNLIQIILEWDKELFLYLNGFYNDFWDTTMFMIKSRLTTGVMRGKPIRI